MRDSVSLKVIVSDRRAEEAKGVRGAMFSQCRAIMAELGDDVSGFAVVAWTRDGELRSGFDTGHGPIRSALIPTLAGDALNRHVALTLAPAREVTS